MAKSKKSDHQDYEIGYKKPPKATQFAKGQSGNPSGRPKGTRNLATIMHAALEQEVTITESGRQKRIIMKEAIAKQLTSKAAAGDANSIRLMMQLIPSMEAILSKTGTTALSNEQDRKVLDEMLKRMQAPGSEVIHVDTSLSESKGEEGE